MSTERGPAGPHLPPTPATPPIGAHPAASPQWPVAGAGSPVAAPPVPYGQAWLSPQPATPWLELERRADAATLMAVAAVAITTDVGIRSGFVGVGGALLTVALAAALLTAAELVNPQAQLVIAAAPLFGGWLALRTSPWLVPFDTLAVCGLLGLGASMARGGSVLDLGFVDAARRLLHASMNFTAGLSYLWGGVREGSPPAAEPEAGAAQGRGRWAAVGVGTAIALPLVIALGALLSSADAVFASFFDLSTILGHMVLLAFGALLAAGLLRVAAAKPLPAAGKGARWLGGLETVIVLAAIDLLFAVFAAAQVVAVSEGGRKIIETTGLSYAEYARSGFFQLVAAAGLTAVSLLVLRAQTRVADQAAASLEDAPSSDESQVADGPAGRPLTRWVKILSLVTVVLTLSLVAVAVRRLDLYMDAYGLTTPRVIVFALTTWIGVVLALLGLGVAGVWRRRAWLGPATVGTGLLVLLTLNIVNPEGLTMSYNAATGHLFAANGRLSEVPGTDGLPALAAALRNRPAPERLAAAVSIACPPRPAVDSSAPTFSGSIPEPTDGYVDDTYAERYRGWAAFNLLREQAGDAQREVCSWRS